MKYWESACNILSIDCSSGRCNNADEIRLPYVPHNMKHKHRPSLYTVRILTAVIKDASSGLNTIK